MKQNLQEFFPMVYVCALEYHFAACMYVCWQHTGYLRTLYSFIWSSPMVVVYSFIWSSPMVVVYSFIWSSPMVVAYSFIWSSPMVVVNKYWYWKQIENSHNQNWGKACKESTCTYYSKQCLYTKNCSAMFIWKCT